MSPRVYRPLAALALGLLLGGLIVWFTKRAWRRRPPRGFGLIRAHCAKMTAEAQRQVGATDSGIIRFAVKRQCATSPTAYAKEFGAFSRCVEKRLGYMDRRDPRHRQHSNHSPLSAENTAGLKARIRPRRATA
jgi:hypothetical protein